MLNLKKSLLILLAGIFLGASIVSCKKPSEPVTPEIPTEEVDVKTFNATVEYSSAKDDAAPTVKKYKYILSDVKTNEVVLEEFSEEPNLKFTKIKYGSYLLQVVAYNSNDEVVGSGNLRLRVNNSMSKPVCKWTNSVVKINSDLPQEISYVEFVGSNNTEKFPYSKKFTISTMDFETDLYKIYFVGADGIRYFECAGQFEIYQSKSFELDETDYIVQTKVTPITFSVEGNQTIAKGSKVYLNCSTKNAKIFYTLDGTTPSELSSVYNLTSGITINQDVTIKAIGTLLGSANSAVATSVYTVDSKLLASPSITPKSGKFDSDSLPVTVTIEGGTDEVIYYTVDGSTPTTSSYKYSAPFTIEESVTVKAISTRTDYEASAPSVAQFTVEKLTCQQPQISNVNRDDYTFTGSAKIQITCATKDAKIYYTVDGTTPTETSTIYSAPITLSETKTVKAIAVKKYYNTSEVGQITFTKATVLNPVIVAPVTTFETSTTATINCETLGAVIYYTLDGTEPTASSLIYSSAITIDKTCSLKAIAILEGVEKSAVVTKSFEKFIPVTNNVKLYIDKSTSYKNIHYWDCDNSTYATTTWPGKTISSIATVEGNDYVITFDNASTVCFIINDGTKKLVDADLCVTKPGEYRVSTNGVYQKDYNEVTILVEKFFEGNKIKWTSCSNSSEYPNPSAPVAMSLSDNGKDYVYTFKNTSSVKATIYNGSSKISDEKSITEPGVYRWGLVNAKDTEKTWRKTCVITYKIEQKGTDSLYLCTPCYDDGTEEAADNTRAAWWESIPAGLCFNPDINKYCTRDAKGYNIRSTRVPEGGTISYMLSMGSYGAECFTTDYSEKYKTKSITAVNGALVKAKAADFELVGKTTKSAKSIARPPFLTYQPDARNGELRLVWKGSDEFYFGSDQTKVNNKDSSCKKTPKAWTVDGSTTDNYIYDFNDLTPGATYYYRVKYYKSESDVSSKTTTTVVQKFVAPKTDRNTDFTFMAWSDSQNNPSTIGDCLKTVIPKYNPALTVACGDIENNGFDADQYRQYFYEQVVPYLNGIPFGSAPGNHDKNNDMFRQLMGMDKRYNSFTYGDALFVTIDVEINFDPGSAQYVWLENVLKNDDHKWKFVFMHESAYCYVPRHYCNFRVRQHLSPLFEKYGVQVAFGGHVHIYDRTTPVNGVTYVTLPCLGPNPPTVTTDKPIITKGSKLYGVEEYQSVSIGDKKGFGVISISGNTCTLKIKDMSANTFDEFTISAK